MIDRDTYIIDTSTDLREVTYYIPPYFALDTDCGCFYAGYMQVAGVDIYALDGATVTPAPTSTPITTLSPTATPTPAATTPAPDFQCVADVNGNGIGDVVDIQTIASDLSCQVYLPLVVVLWHQSWPTDTPIPTTASTPESWIYEETVFCSDEDLSRPEMCLVGDRAYLALRKVITPTASPTLTLRTDYPNGPESQAADSFGRLIQAYGYGNSLVM